MLGYSRATLSFYETDIAEAPGFDPKLNTTESPGLLPICGAARYLNTDSPGARLNMFELSLLAMLSHTSWIPAHTGFQIWFGQVYSNFTDVYPTNFPHNLQNAQNNPTVDFSSYIDLTTNFHYITIRGPNRAKPWLRNMDIWGDSLTLQFAGVLAPHVLAWPVHAKANFIEGIAFLKKIYGGNKPFAELEDHIDSLRQADPNVGIALIGSGFNGGIAEIISARKNVKAVTFNAPGIGYMYQKMGFTNPVVDNTLARSVLSVSSSRNLYSYIDLPRAGALQEIPCSEDTHHGCGSMESIVRSLAQNCGDRYQRNIKV